MARLLSLLVCLVCVACASRSHEEYLAAEAAFLRLGVDRKAEEVEVRRVLAQRKLDVVAVVNGPHFSALGAESRDGKVTAVRVISDRGVVLAEDALFDDLFSPGRVMLVEGLKPQLEDLEVFAFTHEKRGAGAGCVRLLRVLVDGQLSEVVLDVGVFGPRACVISLAHAGEGKLSVELGLPGLSLGVTPALGLELQVKAVPLGKPDPGVRVAKALATSDRVKAERERLSAASCALPSFADRHALAVARAAMSMFVGESKDRQAAAYRECVGVVQPGSDDAQAMADAIGYIERGFSDSVEPAEAPQSEVVEPDAVVVEPKSP